MLVLRLCGNRCMKENILEAHETQYAVLKEETIELRWED